MLRLRVMVLLLCGTACNYFPDRDFEGLAAGDVRATVRLDSGDGFKPKEGVLAQLKGGLLQRRTDANGKVVLRKTPPGTRTFMASLDLDGNGEPEFGQQVVFQMARNNGKLVSVELGNVDLGAVGVLSGRVMLEENGACSPGVLPPVGTVVALEAEDRFVTVDAAGRFSIRAVLPGEHVAMAAGKDALSDRTSFTMAAGGELELRDPLCMRPVFTGGATKVTGKLVPAPGEEDPGLPDNLGVHLRSVLTGAGGDSAQQDGSYAFSNMTPSIYALTVDVDENYVPARAAWVYVPSGETTVPDVTLYLRDFSEDPQGSSSSSRAPASSSASGSSSAQLTSSSLQAASSSSHGLASSSAAPSSAAPGSSSSASSLMAPSSSAASPSSSAAAPSSSAAAPSSLVLVVSSSAMAPSSSADAASSSAMAPSSSAAAPSSSAPVFGPPQLIATRTPNSAANARTRLAQGESLAVLAWTLSVPAGAESVLLSKLAFDIPLSATSGHARVLQDRGVLGELDVQDVLLQDLAVVAPYVQFDMALTVPSGESVPILLEWSHTAMGAGVECRPTLNHGYNTLFGKDSTTPISINSTALMSGALPLSCTSGYLEVTQLPLPTAAADVPDGTKDIPLLHFQATPHGPAGINFPVDAFTVQLTTIQGSPTGNVRMVVDNNRDGRSTRVDTVVTSAPYNGSTSLVLGPVTISAPTQLLIAGDLNGTGSSFRLTMPGSLTSATGPVVLPPAALSPRTCSTFAIPLTHIRLHATLMQQVVDAVQADVDQDGWEDIVLLNDAGEVTALRGLGLNSLDTLQTPIFTVVGTPLFLAVEDMDVDGLMDVVVVTRADFQVFRGTAPGQFQVMPDVRAHQSPAAPLAFRIGDVARNGYPDVVLAYGGVGDLQVWRNMGTSFLAPAMPWTSFVTANVQDLRLVDVDNNGELDVVARRPGALDVLKVNGGFGGGSTVMLGAADTVSGLIASDVNQDGRVDLVVPVASGPNGLGIFTAPVIRGTFTLQATPSTNLVDAPALALMDLRGDGFPDVAALGTVGSGIQVTVAGGSSASTLLAGVGYSEAVSGGTRAVGVFPMDISRDGDLDLFSVAGTATGTRVDFMAADGAKGGGISDAEGAGVLPGGSRLNLSEPGTVLVTADFNLDGRPDVAVTQATAQGLLVNVQAGTPAAPTWAQVSSPGVGGTPADAVAADINGDGWQDVVVAVTTAGNARVSVFLNDHTGNVGNVASQVVDIPTHLGARWLAVADVARDGWLDVVVGLDSPAALMLLKNNAGTLALGTATSLSAPGVDGVLVDMGRPGVGGRDGVPDAVTLDALGNVRLVAFQVDGTASMPVDLVTGLPAGRALASGDVDRDGFQDLVALGTDGSVTPIHGSRNPTDPFVPRASVACATAANGGTIRLGDMDRDGDLDVVVGADPGGLCILNNDHAELMRFFTPASMLGTLHSGSALNAAVVVDVNQDGDLDVLGALATGLGGVDLYRGQ